MKMRYFFTPIGQMFKFGGKSTRGEFFTYAIPSALVAFVITAAWLLEPILANINWYVILPPEMVNDRGFLWTQLDPHTAIMMFFVAIFITQFPMLALSVRRLRDQYAAWPAYLWLFVPFIGAVVIFFHAFAPTFIDYEVTVNGQRMMRSEQLSKRRFRNTVIGAGIVAFGFSALNSAISIPDGMKVQGDGKRVRVNPKMSGLKADGSMNTRNNIWARTKGHVKSGKWVNSYGGKYTK